MTETMTESRQALDALRIDRAPELPPTGAGRRVLWIVLALLVVAAAVVGLLRWRRGAALPRVVTATVQAVGGGSPAVLDASGYVTARRQATVSSKVTGKIVEVLVEEGMAVEEGQVLARLDDTTAQAALRLSRANLEATRRSVAETEVRLKKAELDLERARTLVGKKVAAQADLDAARTEQEALEARLALEREQVEVARREVDTRQVTVDDAVIRAPFDGVAVTKDAQPGEMISPVSAGGGFTRTGICTLVDMSSLEIEVDVGESYIQRVRPDQPVEATLDAYPDWRIPGRVITIVPAADREKATVRVRIAFDRLDPRILPDMGVHVAFLDEGSAAGEEAREPAAVRLLVPRAAIRQGLQGGDVAFVVTDGGADGGDGGPTVSRRPVTTGAVEGERVQVLSGLAAGDRVVVEGPSALADGDRVRIETASGGAG